MRSYTDSYKYPGIVSTISAASLLLQYVNHRRENIYRRIDNVPVRLGCLFNRTSTYFIFKYFLLVSCKGLFYCGRRRKTSILFRLQITSIISIGYILTPPGVVEAISPRRVFWNPWPVRFYVDVGTGTAIRYRYQVGYS